jgi:hypothetical protein
MVSQGQSLSIGLFPEQQRAENLLSLSYSHKASISATQILPRMRSECIICAEKAGYGERHVHVTKLICWMSIPLRWDSQQPTASREEIAFSMLGRWGLPLIPWIQHIFRESLYTVDVGKSQQSPCFYIHVRYINHTKFFLLYTTLYKLYWSFLTLNSLMWSYIKYNKFSHYLHVPRWVISGTFAGNCTWFFSAY